MKTDTYLWMAALVAVLVIAIALGAFILVYGAVAG